jgi:hypothetical protein
MPGEDGVDELRNDGVFVADDAGEERGWISVAAGARLGGLAEFGNEVFAEFIFNAARKAGWSEFAGTEGTEGLGKRGRHV